METLEKYALDQCACVILDDERVREALSNAGAGEFIQQLVWENAYEMGLAAAMEDKIYLLLVRGASSSNDISWIARVETIEPLPNSSTKVYFEGLRALPERQSLERIFLQSSNTTLSNYADSPYVSCITPDFAQIEAPNLTEFIQEDRETIEAYKAALIAIETKITAGQRKMLVGHYHAPGMTLSVTKLAALADYNGAAPGKLQYGKLARKLAEAMHETPPTGDQISMLGQWTPKKDELGHGQWIMYDELAVAIEELGWVE